MEYLIGFFSSLLTNNITAEGYGISGLAHSSKNRWKQFWLYCIFYIIAGVLMGLFAYGLAVFEADHPRTVYFNIIIYACLIAVLVLIFYGISCAAHQSEEFKQDVLPLIVNSSLLGICFYVTGIISEGNSDIVFILVNSLGLACGYVVTQIVFRPIYDRIQASNAGTGFKGIPLILILLAILCLALGALSF